MTDIASVEIGAFDEFQDAVWEKLRSRDSFAVAEAILQLGQGMKSKFEKARTSRGSVYCQRRRLLLLLDVWREHLDSEEIVLLTSDALCCLTMSTSWIKDSIVDPSQEQEQLPTTIKRSDVLLNHGFIEVALEIMDRHCNARAVQQAVSSLLLHWCCNDRTMRRSAPFKPIVDRVLCSLRNHPDSIDLNICAFQLIGCFLVTCKATALLSGEGCMELIAAFVRHPVDTMMGQPWYNAIRRAALSAQLASAMVDLGAIQVLEEAAKANVANDCFKRRTSGLLDLLRSDWNHRQGRIEKGLSSHAHSSREALLVHILAQESESASALFYCLQSSAETLHR